MQVRIINSIAGEGWTRNIGEILTLDPAEAGRLIDAGIAEILKADTHPIETATLTPPVVETATVKTTKAKQKAEQAKAVAR